MKTLPLRWLIFSTLLLSVAGTAFAQGNAFTFHGRLNDNGSPANGRYDLTFSVFDAPNVGTQVGNPLTNTLVGVTNGLFTALLDFGAGIFTGPARWLEMGVRTNGVGDFTTLNPRQLLTPTPYAIMATTASNLLGVLPAGQLSGTLADGQLSANIPRLDGNSTFTGTVNLNNLANSFTGSGGGLTGLNPTNLAAGTAGINISGNAATATTAAMATTATTATTANNFTGSLAGDVTGNQAATVVANVGGQNAANVASGATAANSATAANAPNTIVRRDSSGNFTAGAITATSVGGAGSGLTALNASQLASGTVADERLSANVGRLDASQTFSGSNAYSGVLNATNTGNTFSGNGTGLTGLNPSNLSSGTAGINITGNAATATTATTATTAGSATTATTAATANNFTGSLAGDVTGNQAATVVANVGGQSAANVASGATAANSATAANAPNTLVRRDSAGNFAAGAITATSLSGEGSGVTTLNASQLASGTLADSRLSSNVGLLNANQTFSGSNTLSGVLNATNTANTLAGTFSGSGSGLTGLNPTNLAPGTAVINISGNAATATLANAAPWSGIGGIPAGLADGVDNDTTYSAGVGLSLIGTELSVNLASSGIATQVARSDHDHAGIYAASTHPHSGSDITSGTLADARLSSNVAFRDAHQTFSGSNTFNGVLNATNISNTFNGSGSGLTGLNPANLLTGTAPISISGNAATATTATTAGSATTATTAATANNFTGPLAGDVTGNQNSTVVASVGGQSAANVATAASAANAATAANTPNTIVRRDGSGNFTAGDITATSVSGAGSGLTALNASQLASGTVADERLSADVGRLNANQTFSGSNRFAGVVQLTNTDNTLAGTFSGSGSGLTGINPANLSPGTALINISGNAATATTAGSATTAASATTATTAGSAATFTGPLVGDVTGNQNSTAVANVGGQSAANVASGSTAANSATAANTASTIVRRDSSGNFTAGDITATSLTGSGSGLTALNASQLASGTLADARLSSNVALRNAHQTFSGSNTFTGVLNATNTSNTFSGSGSGLTGLNPTNLAPGTAGINISGNAATATSATSATTAGSAVTATTAGSAPWNGITGIPAGFADGVDSDTLYTPGFGLDLSGTEFRVRFAGGGTADSAAHSDHGHAATDLTSGTLADERLSTNVALLNAPQVFSGSNMFSGVVQLSHTNNTFSGTFSGDGAGLSNVVVAAVNLSGGIPAALLTGTLPSSLLAGSYTNPVTFNHPANTFAGNGAWLSNVNAAALGGVGAASFWQLGGNVGTIAGVDFLGTTDEQPLELRVNNVRAFRLEPNLNGAPNIIGGAPVNFVEVGVMGATISGGGTAGGMQSNSIHSDFATIGGGSGNAIQTLDIASSQFAAISGGQDNTINGATRSVISGGANNRIYSAQHSSYRPTMNSDSTISGGWSNSVEAPFSTIGGGSHNLIRTNFPTRDTIVPITNGTIAGGISNTIWGNHSTIGGGRFNKIRVTGGFPYEFASNGDCTIGGGSFNLLKDSGLEPLTGATIAGGNANRIAELANYAFIGGGSSNLIGYYAWNGVISGGGNNRIGSGGGTGYGTIGGGAGNYVWGIGSTVPGGVSNTVQGSYAFAAGRRAKANHNGAFVWADPTDADFDSTETNSFSVRSVGGARFVSGTDPAGIPLAGVELVSGGGSWSTLSDRNAKENFATISPREVLERVNRMPITTWNYKSQDAAIRHIGPMAQDFAAAFQVGENDRHITTVDADGVALAAIQGLNQKLEEKEAVIQSLQKRLEVLERAMLGRETALNGGGQ